MSTRQADQIIKAGKPVTVHNNVYRETFTRTFVRRDRHNIYTAQGEVFARDELAIVAA